jgi:hypothetical protein
LALGGIVGSGLYVSCVSDVPIGEERAASVGDSRAGSPDSGRGCKPAECQGRIYACGDCDDNDADGLVDTEDPHCLGPCHNREDTFYPDIPGQNRAPCEQDCYFDQDTGSGNDGCAWDHRCDPLSVPPRFDPEGPDCANTSISGTPDNCADLMDMQAPECVNTCLPLTPNGCDCFGCCSIAGGPPVWIGSIDELFNPTCNLSTLDNPDACRPCTQVPSCLNPCDECELCVGKTELPPQCGGPAVADAGDAGQPESGTCPVPACADDRQPCGLDCLPPCSPGQSCVTGCCINPPM